MAFLALFALVLGTNFTPVSAQTADTTPPSISSAQAVNIYGSGAQITWTTNEASDSKVYYGTTAGNYPNTSTNRCDAGGMVTTHCVNLMSLSYSTTYYFSAVSSDAAANMGYSEGSFISASSSSSSGSGSGSGSSSSGGGGSSGSGGTTAPNIYNVRAENIMGTGAQIKWTTDKLADSEVAYGIIYGSYPSLAANRCDAGGTVIDHCINLTSLVYNTTYYYRVKSIDSNGNQSTSESSFVSGTGYNTTSSGSGSGGGTPTTTASSDTSYPIITDVRAVNITNTGAQIKWETDDLSDSRVYYGTTSGYYTLYSDSRCDGGGNVASHCVNLTGLVSGTVYYYQVFSKNLAYLETKSGQASFMSVSMSSDTNPEIAPTPPPLTFATGIVEGKVTDAAGKTLASAGVHIVGADYSQSFNAYTGADGTFLVNVPVGTYLAEIYPPSGRTELIKPSPQKFTLLSGDKIYLNLQFGTAAKTLTGSVSFSDGKPVVDAEVGAYSQDTGQWNSSSVDSLGKYTLRLGGGKWQLGVRPKEGVIANWSMMGMTSEIEFVKDISAETKTQNFIVPLQDSTLNVSTVDQEGKAIAGVEIVADTVSSTETVSGTRTPPIYKKSDSGGAAKFYLASGTYYLRAYISNDQGYLLPPQQQMSIGPGEIKEIKMVLTRRQDVTTVLLSGTVKFDDGAPIDAYIWAWSEDGGFGETRADANGYFQFSVKPNTRWHAGGRKEVGGVYYKSNEILIEVGTTSKFVEVVVGKVIDSYLPPPVNVTQPAAQNIIVSAKDGASVSLPPLAAAAVGTVNLAMTATFEAPSQAAARLVSTAYDVIIKDGAGREVKTLSADAEIVLPYDKAALLAQGVSEDGLMPSYFDEAAETWIRVENYTIDKNASVVVARVRHLTRFALVAAADVTPPSPPTAVAASAASAGIKLVWQNPSKDFDHAKIYRNIAAGSLGAVAAAEIAVAEFIDTGVVKGTTYFYTVRSVDPAGNESANLEQVVALATVSGQAPVAQQTTATQVANARPSGSLIKYDGSATVYVLENGVKRGIPSYDLYQYYFSGQPLVVISSAETYPDGPNLTYGPGSLVKTASGAAVYLILDNGSRYAFKSEQEFKGFGYRFDLVKNVSQADLDAFPISTVASLNYHAAGNFVKYPGAATVYKIENNQKRGVPSLAVLLSHAELSQILTVPVSFVYADGPVLGFADGSLVKGTGPAVYLISGGNKLGFPSYEKFLGLGYSSLMIRTASDADLARHADGGVVD